MTKPPETRIGPSAAAVKRGGRLLSPARYRHPGDVIRLIVAGLVFGGAVAVTAVTHVTYAGKRAVAVTAVVPSTLASRVLAGLVQALFAGAAVGAVVVMLRCRRGAGRPGAVITVGSFDFPKVSCSPRSTARRSPWQGSRYGSCRSWAPASWSIRRADGLIPAGVECVE